MAPLLYTVEFLFKAKKKDFGIEGQRVTAKIGTKVLDSR